MINHGQVRGWAHIRFGEPARQGNLSMNWKDHWKNLPRVDLAEMDGSGLQDTIDSLPLGGCIKR